jgi:magnesium transporter
MTPDNVSLEHPVSTRARRDFTTLREDWTVQETLDSSRRRGLGEKIVYFYVVDAAERLVGVVPTRRLLTAPQTQRLTLALADVTTILFCLSVATALL